MQTIELLFAEVTAEYQKEVETELEENIRVVDKLKKETTTKDISHDLVLGVIPYIKSNPGYDFFLYSETKISSCDQPVLEYIPCLPRHNLSLNLLDFEDTTIFDTPWNKEYEILIRVLIKCINMRTQTIQYFVREISKFLGIQGGEIVFILNELLESCRSRNNINLMRKISEEKRIKCSKSDYVLQPFLKVIKEPEKVSKKKISKVSDSIDFCKVCFLFGCKLHKNTKEHGHKVGECKKTYVDISSIGEFGLFAGENIRKNDFIIDYVGEVITNSEGERRGNFYDLKGSSFLFLYKEGYTIDAKRIGNNGRFLNHSKKGNVVSQSIRTTEGKKICFFAERDIKKGEELLFNYQYSDNHKELYGIKD